MNYLRSPRLRGRTAAGAAQMAWPPGRSPVRHYTGSREGNPPFPYEGFHFARNPGTAETLDIRKGTNGVSTNGVTATILFFDRGTFWVLPSSYIGVCIYIYIYIHMCIFLSLSIYVYIHICIPRIALGSASERANREPSTGSQSPSHALTGRSKRRKNRRGFKGCEKKVHVCCRSFWSPIGSLHPSPTAACSGEIVSKSSCLPTPRRPLLLARSRHQLTEHVRRLA